MAGALQNNNNNNDNKLDFNNILCFLFHSSPPHFCFSSIIPVKGCVRV
jgi:hypothetical protein